MHCLDERKLKDYLKGSLPAELVIRASEHVRECDTCRTSLAALAEYQRAAAQVGSVVTASDECPEYETLSAFVDEKMAGDGLGAVKRHVVNCELCWQDVETLQATRSRASLAPEISVFPGAFSRKRARTVFGWRGVTATALGAVVAVALIVSNPGGVQKQKPDVIANKDVKIARAPTPTEHPKSPVHVNIPPRTPVLNNTTPKPTQPEVITPNPVAPATPAARPERVAVLNDGGVTVYNTGGRLDVKASGKDLESVLAAVVKQKVRSGKLPADMKLAAVPTDYLRDGLQGSVKIEKYSPAPGSIAVSRPTFRWEEVGGAERYRIEVSKSDGTTVLYQETSSNEFHPSERLPAGYYKWTVWVRLGELAEWNASKVAAFRILSKNDSDLLAAARRSYSDSHLVMGTVYEKLGMNREAVAQFRALAKENPTSDIARKMLAGARHSR